MEISLQVAQDLVSKAIEKATIEFNAPICVAVCDKYGFLIAFGRMDGAPVRSIELSQGKAYTAARMGVDTDAFLERLHRENVPASYFCDQRLTGLPGGTVLKDAAGNMVGGAGISGLKPQEDLAIANMMAKMIKDI
ncbi:Uncharacterized conserved protein GlcG, DUF336 family [Pelosinus fermentans]|uniref:GlcG/HbpS family heme-binding protein n=1 Tax=Pelosinus fermentans TaxID=365349 RepID=UPI000268560B|nr:heme-binding protein [Pelosinus fermentans]OAM96368.1 protein of unknown function DUF336 [Pelosinus fermentans DSM 17108]SDR39388.1 Uncharacterized conserved protein GlcG, DUF336 family [Pelosinus fermentans]